LIVDVVVVVEYPQPYEKILEIPIKKLAQLHG
jgi:hypothetical protein